MGERKKKRYLRGVTGVLEMSSKALSIDRDGESLECSIVKMYSLV